MRWLSRVLLFVLLIGVCIIPASAQDSTPEATESAPSFPFTSQSLEGAEALQLPTSLQFGPDGRLYVAQLNGTIRIYTIRRQGQGVYQVSQSEEVDLIHDIPNHDDNGDPQPNQQRQVTGLLVTGTADHPVIYVTSSDYRVELNVSLNIDINDGVDTNSGVISRLTWDGAQWQKLDLVRGLPRSPLDHSTNGLALDTKTNTLYVAQGGNSNMGAPLKDNDIVPEYAYSAAILTVDLNAIGNTTYDMPTLDDPNRPGNPDANDPFGGDGGLNQAMIVPNSPVQIYAPGFRNSYDLVLTDSGRLYTITNGANSGWGSPPTDCTNNTSSDVLPSDPSSLHLVVRGYYAGDPNPTRGSKANLFGGQSPILEADPQECNYIPPAQTHALALWDGSLNGLVEYTASNFDGALKGDLLAADFYGPLHRIALNSSGDQVTANDILFNNFGQIPVDVTAQGDNGQFPGTIWVAVLVDNKIQVFEPLDYGGAVIDRNAKAPYSYVIDSDGDGYSNADEYDNSTDPLNPASYPPDYDHDHISNLNDQDDDNDGSDDVNDPFALDPSNGADTVLPINYTWDGGNPGSGLLGLGFTGVMINHKDDYSALFDPNNIIAGGANGWLTIKNVASGDPFRGSNNQRDALQFGVPNRGAFTVRTRILAPFFNDQAPVPYQAEGIYVGTGDQDNYAKLILNAHGFQVVYEEAGQSTELNYPGDTAAILKNAWIDLYLSVDGQGAITPAYRASDGTEVIYPAIRPNWLASAKTVAVGILATSNSAPTFTAIWDFLTVLAGHDPSFDSASAQMATPVTPVTETPTTTVPAPNPTSIPTTVPAAASSQGAPNALPVCMLHNGTPIPVPRFETQSLLVGQKVYLLGGFTIGLIGLNRLDIYDVAADQWSRGADLPHAVSHQGVAYDPQTNKIWMAGGFLGNDPGTPTDQVWTYDLGANRWDAAPSLPMVDASGQLVLIGRTLHFIGGFGSDKETNLANHWTLNVDDPNAIWQVGLTPMTIPRGHFSTAILNGSIYAIGGQLRHENNEVDYASAERYDLDRDSWTRIADLPSTRSHTESSTFVMDGKIYVIGGRSLPLQSLSDVLVYDPASNTWTNGGYLPAPRAGFYIGVVNGQYVMIGGGTSDASPSTVVWRGQIGQACTSLNDTVALPSTDVQQARAPEALIEIAPPVIDPSHVSTYDPGSFRITNLSAGGQQIVSAQFDISSSLLPDAIFDPDDTKGDSAGKPFTVDQANGLQVRSSTATDHTLALQFASFDPGKTLEFSMDVDPAELHGEIQPRAGGSGGVDGFELINTQVTLTFSDGTQRTTWLYHLPNDDTGSANVTDIPTDTPTLRIVGGSAQNDQQIVQFPDLPQLQVSGKPGDSVLVLTAFGIYHTDATMGPAPNAFAFDSVDSFTETLVTIPASGMIEIPITFTDAGVYTVIAVTQGTNGAFSQPSNRVTFAYTS